MLIVLSALVIGGLVACVVLSGREILKEADYRRQFGDGWQEVFEKDFGSLARAHTRIAVGVIGVMAIVATVIWLYRILWRRGWRLVTSAPHSRQAAHARNGGIPLPFVIRLIWSRSRSAGDSRGSEGIFPKSAESCERERLDEAPLLRTGELTVPDATPDGRREGDFRRHEKRLHEIVLNGAVRSS